MTGLSLGLVLLSALAHASWNLLLKRSHSQEVFIWLLLVTISIFLLPLGVSLFWFNPFGYPGWVFVLVTVALHILYFLSLGRGYALADLSLFYPVARGIGPMLVPVFGVVVLGETIAGLAIGGVAAIVSGIFTICFWGNFHTLVRRPLGLLADPGLGYAVLTGAIVTVYTIVDKKGVDHVQPFLYMYLMTLGSALGMTPYILRKWGKGAVVSEWRAQKHSIMVAGVLLFLAYGLVLTALSLSKVSYVAPAREIGIVIGVLMGVFLLKEPFGGGRLLGSSFIVTGLVLIAVSP